MGTPIQLYNQLLDARDWIKNRKTPGVKWASAGKSNAAAGCWLVLPGGWEDGRILVVTMNEVHTFMPQVFMCKSEAEFKKILKRCARECARGRG